jgi:predicted TIM-barrel fold metal-dependent hydrolase
MQDKYNYIGEYKIWDAHIHFFGSTYNADENIKNAVFYDASSVESVISHMDNWGMAGGITFAPIWRGPIVFDPNYENGNREIYKAQKQYPDRIIGCARVNPNWGDKAVEELERCFENYKLRALKLHPETENFRADNLRLTGPLAELCQKYNAPVVIHIHGYPTTSTPASMLNLARAYPKTPFILLHMGYRFAADARVIAKEVKNIYLGTAGAQDWDVRKSINEIGAERVCFGSDFPYHLVPNEILKISELPNITHEEKELVLGGNLARLCGV